VPKILAQFRGRELELWAKVQEKYLPAVIGNRRHNIGEAAAAIESARVRGAAAMQIDKYADEKVESKEAESINPLLRSHQHHSEVAADRNDSTTPPSLKAVAAGEATTTAATNTNTAIEAAAEVAANAPVLKRSDDATTTRNTTGSSSSSSSCYGNGVQMSSCGRQRSVASKLAADAAESRWKAMANAAGTNACGAGSTGAGAASASASAGAAATCAAGAGAGDGAGAAVALVNVASDCTGSAGTAAAPANTPDMHALAAVNDDNGVVKRNAACVTDTTAIAASYSTAMMTPAAAAASAVLAHLPADQVSFYSPFYLRLYILSHVFFISHRFGILTYLCSLFPLPALILSSTHPPTPFPFFYQPLTANSNARAWCSRRPRFVCQHTLQKRRQ